MTNINSQDLHDLVFMYTSDKIVATYHDKARDIYSAKTHNDEDRYQIFVLSKNVKGVHIRLADKARGGIRISTSADEFYYECQHLVTVQRRKNVFCSVSGSKGCLYPLCADRLLAFKDYIQGIVHLFNNDEHDNMFFCAADVGTGSYLGEAVTIARNEKFWMADVMVSGTSQGFHHKQLGITSRGAIESIKEIEKTLSLTKPYSLVAIGSPRGDVLSNLFRHYRSNDCSNLNLIKAVSSQYVMINNGHNISADVLKLIEEEKGWEHLKRVHIIKRTDLSANDLKSLLQEPCDILYFGGVGTYIGSTSEATANPKLLSARDVQAKMIIEGANLGCTKASRREMTAILHGDFFDNSSAVILSDYEVNIKFALNSSDVSEWSDMVANHVIEKRRRLNQLVTLNKGLLTRLSYVEMLYDYAMAFKHTLSNITFSKSLNVIAVQHYFPRSIIEQVSDIDEMIQSHPLIKEITVLSILEIIVGL